MPENTLIEKTFTYDIADAYLYQTNDLKKTAQWTYTGPRYMWIFVNNETNKISSRFHYTERDNGHDVPTPEGMTKVMVDADKDPCLASLIHNEYTYGELPHTVENLPDGSTYGHPDPIPPDHTYELIEIVYDSASGEFVKPYPWKAPHVTWQDIVDARNDLLLASDSKYNLANEAQKPEWEAYRQTLRDLTDTFAGIDPWKIPFPVEPGANKTA
jgi:hypothetical protein